MVLSMDGKWITILEFALKRSCCCSKISYKDLDRNWQVSIYITASAKVFVACSFQESNLVLASIVYFVKGFNF